MIWKKFLPLLSLVSVAVPDRLCLNVTRVTAAPATAQSKQPLSVEVIFNSDQQSLRWDSISPTSGQWDVYPLRSVPVVAQPLEGPCAGAAHGQQRQLSFQVRLSLQQNRHGAEAEQRVSRRRIL